MAFVIKPFINNLRNNCNMELPFDELYDYSTKGFMMPLILDEMKMYACINTEIVYDEGLAETGSYFIYLLHPKHGSSLFKIEQDLSGHWYSHDAQSFISPELITEIGTEIVERKK